MPEPAASARRIAVASLVLLAGCAAPLPHPASFAFAVIGDTPYGAREERAFLGMIERIDREGVAFVIHVGDIAGGGACGDELLERRKRQFDRFAAPLVYTPGDNEWADCADPAERLARLRSVFFADRFSLGRTRMPLSVQEDCGPESAACDCPAQRENRAWSRGDVRFVTLNVPGIGLNLRDPQEAPRTARCRQAANERWLERAVRAAEGKPTRALVVAMQANPFEAPTEEFLGLQRRLADASRRIGSPLLLVHGDTHTQRVDTPLRDGLGHAHLGITRLESFGSPFMGWVKVGVDPAGPEVFSFEPKLEAIVPRR